MYVYSNHAALGVTMRFIAIILFALLPLSAMASDAVTIEDFDALYEYVDAAAGNSCSAESLNGKEACNITCVEWESALCSSTETRASCKCVVPSPKPSVRDFSKR
jgi:hypothetical protein